MDTFGHGLWVAAIFWMLNLSGKFKKKFKIWQAVAWGVFPDIFSFTIGFVLVIINLISGLASGGINDGARTLFSQSSPIHTLTMTLYAMSHSALIFLVCFILLSLIFRKPLWVMFGWLIHVLIDIPTHGNSIEWATPYLWPFFSPASPGIVWWTSSWFTPTSYALLIVVYGILIIISRKKNKSKK